MRTHEHEAATSSGRLAGAAVANVGFAVVQVAVGLAIGSVAVLADAAHQAVDALGLVTAVGAAWLLRRPAGDRATYGLGRADALGALLSGLLLLGSVAWIGAEAVERLADPPAVAGGPVIVIGLVAIAVNAGSLWLVGHGHALSLRTARLHLLTDLAGSVIVVLTGVVLAGTDALWVDPAASLLLCLTVVVGTLSLLRSAVAVLLDAAPREPSLERVQRVLADDEDVADVHHLHARDLGAGAISITAHLIVERPLDVHESQLLVDRTARRLDDQLGIDHVTLQVECHDCAAPSHEHADRSGATHGEA